MRILGINKKDLLHRADEISEADLKAYLKHVYRSASGAAWEQFVKEGAVATPTTAYYDVDHERVQEAMKRRKNDEDYKNLNGGER